MFNLGHIFNLKKDKKILGFTASTFDLGPHTGHLSMLAECKSQCDFLIVGLLTNPNNDRKEKNIPIQSSFERWVQVSSCEYIDMVIPFDTEDDLYNMLCIIKPNIRFVGNEYKGKSHTGYDINEIDIIYHNVYKAYSSSSLRERAYLKEKNNRE